MPLMAAKMTPPELVGPAQGRVKDQWLREAIAAYRLVFGCPIKLHFHLFGPVGPSFCTCLDSPDARGLRPRPRPTACGRWHACVWCLAGSCPGGTTWINDPDRWVVSPNMKDRPTIQVFIMFHISSPCAILAICTSIAHHTHTYLCTSPCTLILHCLFLWRT